MKMKITTVHQYQMHLSHPPLTVSLLSQHARTSPTYAHTLAHVRKHSTYSLSLLFLALCTCHIYTGSTTHSLKMTAI